MRSVVFHLDKESLPESGPSPEPAFRSVWPSGPVRRERRREARYPTKDPATVDIPYKKLTGQPAVVIDVSRSGLRLELQHSLARGMEIHITLSSQLVIVGEVRYCRRVGALYHAGIMVRNAALPEPDPDAGDHIPEVELGFYLVGKGLSVAEVIELKAHLVSCKSCQKRLQELNSALNPSRKPRP